MAKRNATVTIRVTNRTLSALDILVGELRAKTGKKVTQDEAIWEAIEKSTPHITDRVENLQQDDSSEKSKKN